MKRLLLVQAMLGALLLTTPVFAAHQSGSPSKWENMQVGITYRLYKPGTTLGYKLNRFQAASCGKGHEPWAAATYGTYKGVLGSKTKGFALYEGHPDLLRPRRVDQGREHPDHGRSRPTWACTAIPPSTARRPTESSTASRSQWKAKPSKPYKKNTQMQLDTSRLTLRAAVKIAAWLKKV